MDWGSVRADTGEMLRGLGTPVIIGNWLERGDGDAFASVVTQVSAASTTQVDRLDAALLSRAATALNPDVRLRLIKFYAIFKITEMRRYREFRGFPQ